jgi:hypothetical protein
MKTLTAAQFASASNDEVFDFIVATLSRRIQVGPDHPEFMSASDSLPPGLRAMVMTHHLDVSLTHDDLGWHFGNWHDEQLSEATANGLEHLGASELSAIFQEAYALAQRHWKRLGEPKWTEWYHGSALETAVGPLNTRAWAILDTKWNGILGYWVDYARLHPLDVGAAHDA